MHTKRFWALRWLVPVAASLMFGCAQGVSSDPLPTDEADEGGSGEGIAGGAATEDVPGPAEDEAEPEPVEALDPMDESMLMPVEDEVAVPGGGDADCADPIVVGPNFAKAVINDTTTGTLGWLTPEVVAGDDDLSASYAGLAASNYLFARDFGLSVPDDAHIRGIVVEWQRKSLGAGIKDAEVLIVRNGAMGADNHARTEDWPSAANPMWGTYGLGDGATGTDSTDLWGEEWTPEDINGEGFGVALAVAAGPAFVSRVRVSVHYCP